MVNQIEELERVKKDLDLANDEIQLLNLEIKRLNEIEQSHKKLNGELRLQLVQEVEKVKKAVSLVKELLLRYIFLILIFELRNIDFNISMASSSWSSHPSSPWSYQNINLAKIS